MWKKEANEAMARKSRKTVSGEALTEIKAKDTGGVRTAIYARLSIENSGKDDKGDSIANQVSFCREYIAVRPYLKLVEIYEDNGEKGTDFDRPQFKNMMDDIRAGKIKCVVVKDLSRFGRDYIECGYYLEKIFPFMNVRFIAITDGYDSFTSGDAEGALMVPLKNMINAAYAKDISRKIITSFRARQEKGEFLPAFAPYGYVKSKTKAYRFEVDAETAPYVKLIFEWFAEGVSKEEISRRLTEMGAVTPAMRKVQLGIWKAEKYKHTTWYGRSLVDILKNIEYTGCIAYGKMPKSLYEGIKCHRADPEEWRIVPDAHEPIVSRELYDKVQERFEAQKKHYHERLDANRANRDRYTNLLKGKIVCGDCGKNMRYKKPSSEREVPNYECGGFVDSARSRCSSHHIRAQVVEDAVFQAVNMQIKAAADMEKVIRKLNGSGGEAAIRSVYQKRINEISGRLSTVNEKKGRLYENLVEGLLSDEEYRFAKERYEDDFRRLNMELDEAVGARKRLDSVMGLDADWLKAVHDCGKGDRLMQEMVDAFVCNVKVYEGSRVEVILNYMEDAEEMKRILSEVEQNG